MAAEEVHKHLRRVALQLFDFLQFIEATQEKEVGDLLNDFERIGNPAGPEGIPNGIDLTADFTREHPQTPHS
jgi:hypothetical protein